MENMVVIMEATVEVEGKAMEPTMQTMEMEAMSAKVVGVGYTTVVVATVARGVVVDLVAGTKVVVVDTMDRL